MPQIGHLSSSQINLTKEEKDGKRAKAVSEEIDKLLNFRLIRQIGKSVVFTFSLSQYAGLASIR